MNSAIYVWTKVTERKQHKKKNQSLDEVEDNDIIDIISDEQEDFDNEEEEQIDEMDDAANKTFINPTQVENTDSNLTIKCEICDFRAMSQSEIKNHKTVTHNWCNICFSSFVSQERLKKHLKNKHKIQWRTDWTHHGESSW